MKFALYSICLLSCAIGDGPGQITVGEPSALAFSLDLTVQGVNFKTFWNEMTDAGIHQEGHSVVCPAISAHVSKPVRCDGLIGVVIETLLYRRDWGAADYGMRYMNSVYDAVVNDEHFKIFKDDFRYKNIVESLGPSRASEFLQAAFAQSPELFYDELYFERVRANDHIGAPQVVQYAFPSRTAVSGDSNLVERQTGCSIIRYVKVVSDLHLIMNILKDSSIRSVAEIGIGFGGQAQVLLSHPAISPPPGGGPGRVMDYYFFDLPIVRQLAAKYLSKFPWLDQHRLHFMDSDWDSASLDKNTVFDLCISNYAVSEFSVTLQDRYIDTVLKRCRRGYILYNAIGEYALGTGYTVYQFANKIKDLSMYAPILATDIKKEYTNASAHSALFYWIGSPNNH